MERTAARPSVRDDLVLDGAGNGDNPVGGCGPGPGGRDCNVNDINWSYFAVVDVDGNSGGRSTLIRHGAVLGVIGSVGAAIGNILHPQVPDNPAAAARLIAESSIWVPAHLLIAVTVFLMVFGLLALTASLNSGPARVWAIFGLIAGIAGVVIGIILMAADGITAKNAAVEWLSSTGPEQVVALGIAGFSEQISFGLVVMFNIFFGGLTFLFFGIAVTLSVRYPRWLGLLIAVVGALSIAIGVTQALAGTSSPTIEVLTVITPTLFTLWTLTMCVWILKKPRHRTGRT